MGKESGVAKFGTWVAGIAATVISGYLLWYFTVPKPPVVTVFEGMVYTENAPVAKAMVSLNLTGTAGAQGPIVDFTDDNGAYKFELTGLPEKTAATLKAEAKGYQNAQPRSLPMPLQPDIRLDIPLIPQGLVGIAGPIGAPAPSGGGGGGKQAPLVIAHIPAYVPKIAAMAKRVKVGP